METFEILKKEADAMPLKFTQKHKISSLYPKSNFLPKVSEKKKRKKGKKEKRKKYAVCSSCRLHGQRHISKYKHDAKVCK